MEKDNETYDVELTDTINDSIENRKAYFVRPFGTEESNGPFRGRDLLSAIKSGGILQNDLIRRESSNNWHRVDEIAELQHLFQQAQTIRTQKHKTKSIPLKWIILAIVMLTLVIESAFWVGGLTSDLAGEVLIAGLALILLTLIIGNLGHGIRRVAKLGRIIKSSIKKGPTKSVNKVNNLGNKSKKPSKKLWTPVNLRWICAVVAICLTILIVGKITSTNTEAVISSSQSAPEDPSIWDEYICNKCGGGGFFDNKSTKRWHNQGCIYSLIREHDDPTEQLHAWCDSPGITPAHISDVLEEGARINSRIYGITPLMRAARFTNDPEVLRTLIVAGARVNSRDESEFGETALMIAAASGQSARAIGVLLDAGADANEKIPATSPNRKTVLMRVVLKFHSEDYEVVKLLLKAGSDVNAIDLTGHKSGGNALNLAVYEQPLEVIQLLLDAGAEVNIRSESTDLTPFITAAEYCPDPKVCVLLLSKVGKVSQRDKEVAIIEAAFRNNIDVLKFLLNQFPDFEIDTLNRALNCAAGKNEDTKVHQHLIQIGADVNYIGSEPGYKFGLKFMNESNMSALLNAARSNKNPEVLLLLLEAGADPCILSHWTRYSEYAGMTLTSYKNARDHAKENEHVYDTDAYWALNDALGECDSVVR